MYDILVQLFCIILITPFLEIDCSQPFSFLHFMMSKQIQSQCYNFVFYNFGWQDNPSKYVITFTL